MKLRSYNSFEGFAALDIRCASGVVLSGLLKTAASFTKKFWLCKRVEKVIDKRMR